ncbi:MAG TPA: hypothetical protein VIV60_08845 [Polyangiaceae bacterium]
MIVKPRYILLSALVWLALVWHSTAFAKGALNDEAQKHFDAGVAYVDDPSGSKWEEALKEFRAAYTESPTWKLMNNIGLCALNLERDGEAIEAYKEYLAHGGEKDLSPKQRKQIEKDIATLSASLVRVTVEVEPSEAMLFDERKTSKGELLVNRYAVKDGKVSIGIHPGRHKFTVEATGYISDTWTVEAEPASTHQHRFKLDAEKRPEAAPSPAAAVPAPAPSTMPDLSEKPAQRRNLTGVYIGLAATGVFAVAATVTGVITMGKAKDFDKTSDPNEADRIRKSGKTFSLLTDIGAGAAIVSAGVTAILYFTAPKSEPAKPETAQLKFTPVASPNAAGLAMYGQF